MICRDDVLCQRQSVGYSSHSNPNTAILLSFCVFFFFSVDVFARTIFPNNQFLIIMTKIDTVKLQFPKSTHFELSMWRTKYSHWQRLYFVQNTAVANDSILVSCIFVQISGFVNLQLLATTVLATTVNQGTHPHGSHQNCRAGTVEVRT